MAASGGGGGGGGGDDAVTVGCVDSCVGLCRLYRCRLVRDGAKAVVVEEVVLSEIGLDLSAGW